ncbi:MAG: carbohydrate ABC transporter permease, partial [Deinococcus sp.]|nr:carbohydrate ABC transporter permease [Deinococcus sp.]
MNTRLWLRVQLMFLYGVLIAVSLFMLLPFLWMLRTSFLPKFEIFTHPPTIFSPNMNLDAFRTIWLQYHGGQVLLNSFIIALGATLLQLLFSSLGGYSFAKFVFPGRNALFFFLLGTLIIPFSVIMVPLFVVMRTLHWIDTFWALIIPGAASAFGIFFTRQYIQQGIESELLDAARIDGASEWGVYWSIVLPVIRPGLISLGLIFFMTHWNSFLWPLVILKSPAKFTLPLLIR